MTVHKKSSDQILGKAMSAAFKSGDIARGVFPEILLEQKKAIDPNSEDGKYVQELCGAIVDKLLKAAGRDDLMGQTKFLLLDDKSVNACILVRHDPPIVMLNKGVFEHFSNVDQLAYLLGHEISHRLFRDEVGAEKNSKIEENICDLRPLQWMHAAGYDARAAIPVIKNFLDIIKEQPPSMFDVAFDPHSLPQYRLSMVERGVAMVDRSVGGLYIEPTPFKEGEKERLASAEHKGHIATMAKKFGYDGKSLPEQVNFLSYELGRIPEGYTIRAQDINKLIGGIKPDPEKNKEQIEQLTHAMLKSSAPFNSMFAHVKNWVYSKSDIVQGKPLAPFGHIATYSALAKQFINAKDEDTAKQTATALMDFAKSNGMSLERGHVIQNMLMSRFPVAPAGAVKSHELQWDKFLVWAKADTTGVISDALLATGVHLYDARLLKILSDDKLSMVAETGLLPFGHSKEFTSYECKGGVITHSKKHNLDDVGYAASLEMDRRAEEGQQVRGTAPAKKKPQDAIDQLNKINDYTIDFDVDIDPDEFVKSWPDIYNRNMAIGAPPAKTAIIARAEFEMQQTAEYRSNISSVISQIMHRLAKDGNPAHREFVRSFFTKTGPYMFSDFSNRLSENDPLVKFVVHDKENLFSAEDRFNVLAKVPSEGGHTSDPDYPDRGDDNDQNEVGKQTRSMSRLHTLEKIVGIKLQPMSFAKYNQAYPRNVQLEQTTSSSVTAVLLDVMAVNLDSVIRKTAAPKIAKDKGFLEFLEYANPKSDHLIEENKSRFVSAIKLVKEWPEDVGKRIDIYLNIAHNNAFPSFDWRDGYADKMFADIAKIEAPEKRAELLEKLLGGGAANDVYIRNRSKELWIAANKELFGIDSGVEAYHQKYDEKFNAMVLRIRKECNFHVRHQLFSELAEALQTQKTWSYTLRDNLVNSSSQTAETSQVVVAGAEISLMHLADDPKNCRDTLDFLSSPYSDASGKQFAKSTKDATDKFTSSAALSSIPDFNARAAIREANDEKTSRSEQKRKETEGVLAAQRFYENFWAAPLPVRALIIDELLSRNGNRGELNDDEREQRFRESLGYAMDKVLPTGIKYSKEAREFVDAYVGALPTYQRPLFIAAMLAAGEKAGEQAEVWSVGKRLAYVAEMMGPAEVNTLQKAHSHPTTPEDIRHDLSKIKSKAAPSERWEVYERYENVVPEEYRKGITRLGKVLGSGSYFETVELEHVDGTNSVVALQRPNAQARAKEGFRILGEVIKTLQNKGGSFAASANTLSEIMGQAEDASRLGTIADIGAQQAEQAADLYNGMHVAVKRGDKTYNFNFGSAQWMAYGAEFRDQKKVAGKHFNDLPEDTEEQREYKKAFAQAYVALEYSIILRGGVIDRDRHGAQIKVNGENAGLFDHGGMTVKVPNDEEKKEFAELLLGVINDASKAGGKSNMLTLFQERLLEACEKNHNKSPYMADVATALLALNDFQRYLDPEKDMMNVLGAIFAFSQSDPEHGKIDPVFMQAAVGMMMSGRLDMQALSKLQSDEGAIVMGKAKQPEYVHPRKFDTQVVEMMPNMRLNAPYKLIDPEEVNKPHSPSAPALTVEPKMNVIPSHSFGEHSAKLRRGESASRSILP